MIQTIIDALDAAIALHLPTVARHGIAELMPIEGGGTQPVVYASNGSFTQIANDNAGSFSYWRHLGRDTTKAADIPGQACGGFEVSMPLRFVAMVDRSICPNVQNAARAASWAAMDTDGAILATTKAMLVNFTASGVDTDSRRVYQAEFGKPLDTTKAFVAIDLTVVVTGMPECFDPCDTPGDFACAFIQSKTWAQIQQCLTDAQEAAAIADLCDVACDPFAISINGDPYEDVLDPCGTSIDIPIYDSDGTIVATTIVGGQVRVDDLPCTGGCLMTVNVTVNGVAQTPILNVDPCVENNLTITVN